jgi:hypothetical protein
MLDPAGRSRFLMGLGKRSGNFMRNSSGVGEDVVFVEREEAVE